MTCVILGGESSYFRSNVSAMSVPAVNFNYRRRPDLETPLDPVIIGGLDAFAYRE